eukprot:866684-Prymnesium_polylepis.1
MHCTPNRGRDGDGRFTTHKPDLRGSWCVGSLDLGSSPQKRDVRGAVIRIAAPVARTAACGAARRSWRTSRRCAAGASCRALAGPQTARSRARRLPVPVGGSVESCGVSRAAVAVARTDAPLWRAMAQ